MLDSTKLSEHEPFENKRRLQLDRAREPKRTANAFRFTERTENMQPLQRGIEGHSCRTTTYLLEREVGQPERKKLRSIHHRGQRGRHAQRPESCDGVFGD